MKISDLVKMGVRNLLRRKARTSLTVVGVVIGTISIVVMISIGIGMNQTFRQQLMENGGMSIINVSNYSYDQETGESGQQKLDLALVEQLRAIEHVRAVSPVKYGYGSFYSGKYSTWGQLYIIDFSTLEAFGMPPAVDGTYPTEDTRRTILLGKNAIQPEFQYWSGRSPKVKEVTLGKDPIEFRFEMYQPNEKKKPYALPIDNYKFLQEETSEYSMYNHMTLIDLQYYNEIFTKYANTLKLEDRKRAIKSINEYENIQINCDSLDNVTAVQDIIKEMGYQSNSGMQGVESIQSTAKVLQIVLGAIGGVAMLVSAINIANTMIMSIYERTKEIGVMKVLGCFIKDIRKLFLFEAALIGLFGGTVGLGLSYAASWAINKYGGEFFGNLLNTGWLEEASQSSVSVIPFWLPFLAVLFAMIVGIVSGFLPALRATKISAIEAMKTEG